MTDELPPAHETETSFFAGEWGATPENVVTSRRQLAQWLKDIALEPDQALDILLAVSEAVTNAMEHGSRFDTTQLVSLQATLHGESLTVTVNDHGRWLEPPDHPPTRSQHRGRGLHLINELADNVNIAGSAHGTQITMRFDLAEQIEPPLESSETDTEIGLSDFGDQLLGQVVPAIGAEVDLHTDTTAASTPHTVSDGLPAPPAGPEQPAIGDAAPA
jgi:anti-sigma regulatory factor (Ser/Thr protein kinase)